MFSEFVHLNLPLQHLRLELDKLRAVLAVRVRELQARGPLGGPADLPLPPHLDPTGVEALLAEPGGGERTPAIRAAEDAVDAALERLEAFLAEAPRGVLPLHLLQQGFDLDFQEYHLLLLAAAPHFDPGFARLYAVLHQHPERAFASLALLQDATTTPRLAPGLQRLLDPEGPLLGLRLLHLVRARPELPDNLQPLAVDPRVLRFLAGDPTPEPRLGACAELLHDVPTERARFFLPAGEEDAWATLTRLTTREEPAQPLPLFVLRGAPGIGKRRRALELARRAEQSLLCVDLGALRDAFGDLPDALRLARREARLQGAALALRNLEALLTPHELAADDPSVQHLSDALLQRAARELTLGVAPTQELTFLLLEASATPLPTLPGVALHVHPALPLDGPTALKLWRFILPHRLRHAELDLDALAGTFRLTPGQIHDAVAQSRDAAPDAPIHPDALRAHIKAGIRHRLGTTAQLVERAWTWDDLILPRDVLLQLREFVHRFRFRDRVLQQWGLQRRFGAELGLSALFEGPPGTGKTMSASVIARELGLDLYQIDLSRVVSRYIGETEKNLGRIFDEAEHAQAMILFDEADALFGKRTEVKSSNDRYANLEVNYLLQRLEAFTGVTILTTNFGASIDDAFARRLSFRVYFPRPAAEERERLWRSMLNAGQLPLARVDYAQLANTYDLAGGHIKNAVLRAAFLAASRDQRLDHALLDLAARMEMKAHGMLVQGAASLAQLDP